jgi:4'-phosphopantetheinyl transferase
MRIYWLEQTQDAVPAGNTGTLAGAGTGILPVASHRQDGDATFEFLSARELAQLNALRLPKRREEWLLGRWTAKQAVAACLNLPSDFPSLAKIELRPTPSGAPETFVNNKWAPVTISLSHRAGRAVCAVAPSRGALGCDIEVIEARSDAFTTDFFDAEEQALVARTAPDDRPWLVTLLWSAKESALKALHAGLRLDTRCVIVTPLDTPWDQDEDHDPQPASDQNPAPAVRRLNPANRWRPLRVRHLHDQTFLGWWQYTGNLMRTTVAAPPPARPFLLAIPRRTTTVDSAHAQAA